MNVALLLEMAAEGAPARVAIGPRDTGLTTAELLARARGAAVAFTAAGVDNVGLVDTNSEATPIALFGAALAGLPFAPLNYRLADEQLRRVVARLAPALVVAGAAEAVRVPRAEGIEVVERAEFLGGFAHRELESDVATPSDPDATAVVLFTSGTTGEPKAALLRHRHLTSYVIGSVEFMGAGADDAQLVSVPPYHVAGIAALLSALYAGRRIVYLPEFDPAAWITTVRVEHITHAMVVPTMLGRILDEIEHERAHLDALRHLSYGGGRMPVDVIERAMRLLPHVDFVNAYGLTETSSTVTVLTPQDHRDAITGADAAVRARLGSVGRALPTVELTIRDPDGSALREGESGEVWVRGDQVAGEYEGEHCVDSDGWFRTHDAGYLDADGYLFLDGRLDDVIVRGGENISPGEIETVLAQHPAVAAAAVVGIPDAQWGETIAAVVVLAPGAHTAEAELRTWVRQHLRSTRTPELIQIRAELPYNETGKLLRRVLRAELAAIAAARVDQ